MDNSIYASVILDPLFKYICKKNVGAAVMSELKTHPIEEIRQNKSYYCDGIKYEAVYSMSFMSDNIRQEKGERLYKIVKPYLDKDNQDI